MMVYIKLTHIKRFAMAIVEENLQDENRMTIEDTLVEGVRIGTDDGTLQHGLYEWDIIGSGVISATLGRTFPLQMQFDGMLIVTAKILDD
jgi:hypothetical protein